MKDGMDIGQEALRLLRANRRSGYSALHGQQYAYTCPSPERYPFQWFWDSCFHAIVLAHLEPEWAQRELRTLVSVQHADGFLPHAIFWRDHGIAHYWKYTQSRPSLRPRTSAYMQPPVLAFAVLHVFSSTGNADFAGEMLGVLRRFHAWLRVERDPDEDGLISIVSPFESGLDWSPQFDAAIGKGRARGVAGRWLATRTMDLRHLASGHRSASMLARFDVEEIATNAIWYEAQMSLAELALRLGEAALAEGELQGAERTRDSLLGRCWDPEAQAFFSLCGSQERRLRVRTVASLVPLIVDGLASDQVQALVKDIEEPRRFGTPAPLPSVAADEPAFLADTRQWVWRGPSWMNMNWYVVRGLLKYGYRDAAQRIVDASLGAVEGAGFWECFQPYTGLGRGAPNFAWTTLVVEMQRLLADPEPKNSEWSQS